MWLFLKTCLFSFLPTFLIGVLEFFVVVTELDEFLVYSYTFYIQLHILDANPLSDVKAADIFSHAVGRLLALSAGLLLHRSILVQHS